MAEGNGNGKKTAYSIGVVVIAFTAILVLFNEIPWETTKQATDQQASVTSQIADLKNDIAGVKNDQRSDTNELRDEIKGVAGEVQQLEGIMLQNRAVIDPPARRKVNP
jgi:hypothetical protein